MSAEIELLKEQLKLESLRRTIAETRLANQLELSELRRAQHEKEDELYIERRNKLREDYEKYSSEHYRNAQALHDEYKGEVFELSETVRQQKAALALKDKELCELRGGCV